jgi:hypothetical protein
MSDAPLWEISRRDVMNARKREKLLELSGSKAFVRNSLARGPSKALDLSMTCVSSIYRLAASPSPDHEQPISIPH